MRQKNKFRSCLSFQNNNKIKALQNIEHVVQNYRDRKSRSVLQKRKKVRKFKRIKVSKGYAFKSLREERECERVQEGERSVFRNRRRANSVTSSSDTTVYLMELIKLFLLS